MSHEINGRFRRPEFIGRQSWICRVQTRNSEQISDARQLGGDIFFVRYLGRRFEAVHRKGLLGQVAELLPNGLDQALQRNGRCFGGEDQGIIGDCVFHRFCTVAVIGVLGLVAVHAVHAASVIIDVDLATGDLEETCASSCSTAKVVVRGMTLLFIVDVRSNIPHLDVLIVILVSHVDGMGW